jgi:hypothetical protein
LNVELVTEPVTSIRNFGLQLWPRMTEAKWLASDDAVVMLDYALGRVSQRKLRLFAIACCRRLGRLAGRQSELANAAESYADGHIDRSELDAVVARAPRRFSARKSILELIEGISLDLASPDGSWAAYSVVRYSPWHAAQPPLEVSELADLLRHIAGNPFRPYRQSDPLPSPACRLAEALYAGEDCAFALRDALLEAGQIELAEHLQGRNHPKGCWALDIILGKE